MHSSYSYLVDNSCFSTALLLQTLPRPPTNFARRHLYSVLFDKNLWCVVITLFVSECDAGAIIMCSFRAASRAIPLVKARKATSQLLFVLQACSPRTKVTLSTMCNCPHFSSLLHRQRKNKLPSIVLQYEHR